MKIKQREAGNNRGPRNRPLGAIGPGKAPVCDDEAPKGNACLLACKAYLSMISASDIYLLSPVAAAHYRGDPPGCSVGCVNIFSLTKPRPEFDENESNA